MLAGGAIFALAHVFEPDRSDEHVIVVDDVLRRQLLASFLEDRGRPPREGELDEVIDHWIDREVLYRSGLEIGLDRGDRFVRNRVADRMRDLLTGVAYFDPPADDELREYFERNRERYEAPARFDIRHVYVDGLTEASSERAERLLRRLRAGEPPKGMGDRFHGGHHLRRRTAANLTDLFGAGFVEDLDRVPTGEWHLRRSTGGWHVVMVEGHRRRRVPAFEEVRDEILGDLTIEQREDALRAELDTLRQRFDVRRE